MPLQPDDGQQSEDSGKGVVWPTTIFNLAGEWKVHFVDSNVFPLSRSLALTHTHTLSGQFQELCAVGVLPVASGVAVCHAAETLPLHRNTEPHAQPAGRQRLSPG